MSVNIRIFLIISILLALVTETYSFNSHKKQPVIHFELAEVETPTSIQSTTSDQSSTQEESADDSDSISRSEIEDDDDQDPEEVGCANTPLGCFGTHRALHSIVPILICCCIGAGLFVTAFGVLLHI